MNSIVQILVAVLNSLWQAAIVAALVLLALKLARRRNPAMNAATRYVVWWAALGVVLVLPAAPGALALWRTRAAHTGASTAPPKAARPLLPSVNFEAPALITLREQRSTRWPFWVLGIWSAAFLYRLIEIARSYFYLRGVKRRAVISSQPLPENKRSARLLLSGEVLSPMAVGFLRPAVILPETLPAEITGEELHHVLLHEHAHLARLDDWLNLIAHLLGAVLDLHPPAWWILRQIGREREMACDDWVVARTGSARPYAASLARLSELRWSRRQQAQGEALASGMFGGGSRLGERIELLLSGGSGNPARSRLLGGLFSAALFFAIVAGSFAPRWIAFAQRLEFEVASVKPADPNGPNQSSFSMKGGRFEAVSNLRMLIQFAYEVRNHQISGGPSWMDSLKFAIEAKPDSVTPLTPGVFTPASRAMVKSLLEDRFKLALHSETREQPIYYLELTRGGSHLKPAKKEAGVGMGENRISSPGAPIATLANMLTAVLGRSVIDRTGLEGLYEFGLEWTPDDTPADLATGPSLFTAIQEQLGLRLESAKGPVKTLVIDRAEKPTEN